METKITPQPPHAQCCVGFETDVDLLDKVCHHCGRAIAQKHQSIPILGEPRWPNPEFRHLGLLGAEQQSAVHCDECAQSPAGWANLWRKFFRLLGGFFGLDWLQKRWYLGRYRPPAPLTPDVTGVAFEEKLEGTITLDSNGVYRSESKPPVGEFKVNFRFLERERSGWEAYCRGYGLRKEDLTAPFHAGFALLKDPGNINLQGLPADASFSKTGVLEFKGRLNELEFFKPIESGKTDNENKANEPLPAEPVLPATLAAETSSPPTAISAEPETATTDVASAAPTSNTPTPVANQPKPAQPSARNGWAAKFNYAIVRRDGKEIPLLLRLTPTIVPNDQGHTLELTLQLNLETGTSPDLTSLRVEELTIEAPAAVGEIVAVNSFTTVSKIQPSGAQAKVTITWQGGLELSKERPQASVRVRYANPLDSTMSIEGKIKASGSGTLSGIKAVRLFYPWGQQRLSQPNTNRKTTVSADFKLSLASLRFQEAITQTDERQYTGHVLDTQIIETLTRHLGAANLYVRQVTENPAYANKTNLQLVNRFWDIAGRAYSDAHPLDFHLVLTGTHHVVPSNGNGVGFEPTPVAATRAFTIRPHENKINVIVSLHGVTTNPAMKQHAERVFENLRQVLENTFR